MLYFQLPFNETLFSTDGNPDISLVNFTSFDGNEKISMKGNIIEKLDKNLDLKFKLHENQSFLDEETKVEYTDKLKSVVAFIKENKLEKLVISRRKLVNYSTIDIAESFRKLRECYPNAFAYLFNDNGECWMGAFSEILGKFNKKNNVFETMSLAGTLPVDENWSQKEIEEQRTVTHYIKNILLNYAPEIVESKTKDHISGNIKHLRTDFELEIEASRLEQLISDLHPTPAVCGTPKDFCLKVIQNFEKYPREFYAGYSKVETEDFIYYFVNLRCAKLYQNTAVLFVGGGINKDSQPEKEWLETELKAEAIAKNLVIS